MAQPSRQRSSDTSIGAYGFRLLGIRVAASQLVPAPAHWPALELIVRITSESAPESDRADDKLAVLRLRSGGFVELDRHAGRAVFRLSARPDERALVHPHLAGVAAVAAHWLGRESFHAGAFVVDGGVWGLLGAKGSGKSSLLASLALSGVPVLCDDVLVVDNRMALAGPRSIDLRRDAASRLGAGEFLGVVGARERWRLALEPVAAELPLRGWVVLNWNEQPAAVRLKGSDKLRALFPHRGTRLYPPRPEKLIELSSLPFLELRRQRRWGSAGDALDRMLDAVAST